jgi:Acetyl-CoA carboxylase alpha subunit
MKGFGLVDDIIPEPAGGAHWDYNDAAQILKDHLIPVLQELKRLSPEERIDQRIEKFGKMGFFEELPEQMNKEPKIISRLAD